MLIIYSHKYIKAKVILMLMICHNINDKNHIIFEQIINKEVIKQTLCQKICLKHSANSEFIWFNSTKIDLTASW